jgi:hypothetical protein
MNLTPSMNASQDITQRDRRVPRQTGPHPNSAEYFSQLIIGVPLSSLGEYTKIYAAIAGIPPKEESDHKVLFQLESPWDARGTTLTLEARDDLLAPAVQRVFFATADGTEAEIS